MSEQEALNYKSLNPTFIYFTRKEDPTSLISTFFHALDANPSINDWSLSCRKDMEELDIKMSYDDIQEMSCDSFKKVVSEAILKLALEYLNSAKGKLNKVKHIPQNSLTLQKYFAPKVTNLMNYNLFCEPSIRN